MQRKTITYRQKNLSYQLRGKGPAIVLVHGFGETGSIWSNQYHLFPEHLLLVPDLPGSGESEMNDAMTMEGMAEAIRSILDHESIRSCTMIGHSMGGYITMAFADQYASMLNALGLFHSTSYADNEEKKANRLKGIAFIKEHGGRSFLRNTINNLYGPRTKKENPSLIEEHIASCNFSDAALVQYYESMMNRPDRRNVLSKLSIPVMFIAGRNDNAVALPDILEQSHLPPLSYIHILEQSGHMGMVEEPEATRQQLHGFIELTQKTFHPE
jgi:pimeloyl-ACP methyl ester carboxylesterase